MARSELLQARTAVGAVEATVQDGDTGALRNLVAALQPRTARAKRLTGDPVWRIYAKVPILGSTFRTAAELADVADELTHQVLPDLVTAAGELAPTTLRPAGDRISVPALERARPPLARAADRLGSLRERVDRLSPRWTVGALGAARRELLTELDRFAASSRTAVSALTVAPRMLGGSGPRRYFLAVQNNAESRGAGGLIGSYAIVRADQGRLSLEHVGPNIDLKSVPGRVVPVAVDFAARYRRFEADSFWLNANMSPHFPYTNTVITELYRRQSGVSVDGTIAIDPVGLGYLLDATGPATLPDGTRIDGAGIVAATMRDAYARFEDEDDRDAFFIGVAEAAYRALTGGGDPVRLLEALGRAVGEGHIQMASNEPAIQDVLLTLPISGAVPTTPGPYLQVAVNNAGGTKLDFYLRREIRYSFRRMPDGTGRAVVDVTLRNTAPARGLPAYVTARPDLREEDEYPLGQNRLYVSVFAGIGATLERAAVGDVDFARLQGVPGTPLVLGETETLMEVETERGHSVFSSFLEIDPGKSITLHLELREPDGRAAPVIRSQPLVAPDLVTVVMER